MVLCQSKTVRSRQRENVSFAFVRKPVSRTIEGGVQQSFVAYPGETAIFCKRSGMEEQNRTTVNPARLLHFAKARKVSLYSLMNSRPSFTCASTSGSYGVRKYPLGASMAKSASSFLTFSRWRISFGRTKPVEVPTARSLSFIGGLLLYTHNHYNLKTEGKASTINKLID